MRTSLAMAEGQFSQGEELQQARPFIKWAGGKRQLLPVLLSSMPKQFNRYFEPMIGGGALYFATRPKQAFISDINEELINLYGVVRDSVEALLVDLKRHIHTEEYYYELRNVDRTPAFKRWGKVRRASRFIYLNRTCFNGLYRVNSSGHFNVPFGKYVNPKIVDPENLRACSTLLQATTLSLGSFEVILQEAKRGDFVYFDPPYAPLTATSNFTSYTQEGFGSEMQVALRDYCVDLNRRGVRFMLSNSSAPLVLDLFADFDIKLVEASRAINSKGSSRGKVKEVLVRNY